MATITPRSREKAVSWHFKRRRADARCDDLNSRLHEQPEAEIELMPSTGAVLFAQELRISGRPDGTSPRTDWLKLHGFPTWVTRFDVKKARTRFHYKVVGLER